MEHTYSIYAIRLQNNLSNYCSFVDFMKARNMKEAVFKAFKDDGFGIGHIYATHGVFAVRIHD